MASRQFIRLEHRLQLRQYLCDAYHAFMRDYLENGHMELADELSDSCHYEPYFIPHHPVHRPDDLPSTGS